MALELARHAGIAVPDARIEHVGGKPVIVLRRFDRIGQQRVPFVSAMSMLGASDNETHSYMEIADALRFTPPADGYIGIRPEQVLPDSGRNIGNMRVSKGGFVFRRIDHVAFVVKDRSKSVRFYEEQFGFKTYYEHDVPVPSIEKIVYLKLGTQSSN